MTGEHTDDDSHDLKDAPKPSRLRRFMRSKALNYVVATGVLAFGMASLAFGGAPIAMGSVALAIEMYKVTPSYDKFTKNTQFGRALHKVTKLVFSKFNRRVFRIVMSGIAIAGVVAATGGVAMAAIAAVNVAGVAYNVTQEIRAVRKARRLCKQAAQVHQYKTTAKAIDTLLAHHPDLYKRLSIKSLEEKSVKPPASPPLPSLKKTFAQSLASSVWESAVLFGESLLHHGSLGMAALVTVGEVSHDARHILHTADKTNKLTEEVKSLNIKPEELEHELQQQHIVAKALSLAIEDSAPEGLTSGNFVAKFQEKQRQVAAEVRREKSSEKWHSKVASAVVNVAKDAATVHTHILVDPVGKIHDTHDTKMAPVQAHSTQIETEADNHDHATIVTDLKQEEVKTKGASPQQSELTAQQKMAEKLHAHAQEIAEATKAKLQQVSEHHVNSELRNGSRPKSQDSLVL